MRRLARLYNGLADLTRLAIVLVVSAWTATGACACGGASQSAATPGLIETASDCWACSKCAKDLIQRYAAAHEDAGPAVVDGGAR